MTLKRLDLNTYNVFPLFPQTGNNPHYYLLWSTLKQLKRRYRYININMLCMWLDIFWLYKNMFLDKITDNM